jgi:RND family efflux transporter MFP subunit
VNLEKSAMHQDAMTINWRGHSRAERPFRRIGRLAGAAALAVVFLAGCDKKDDANAYVPPPPPEVIVAHPLERDVVSYMTYTGVVEASANVDLRARVQGFLEKINFRPGQRVKKGDLLFTIDPRQYQAYVDQAEAAVAAQRAVVVGTENDAKLAKELAEQSAGPAIDAVIKAARYDAAKADLSKAEAALREAKLNLEFCRVLAPMDGRITDTFVDEGNLVGRGEPTLLATIVQLSPAYVSLDVSESDVLKVRRDDAKSATAGDREPGQVAPDQWRPCELALAGENDFKTKGRVDYVDPRLNAQTGTLRVRTEYPNTDEALIPGFFSRVRFPITSAKAILVPEAALLSDQRGRYALVVNEKDEVEVRRVTIGVLEGEMRVVEQGLATGDRVIVLGVLKARPGAKVTPKMQEAAATGR